MAIEVVEIMTVVINLITKNNFWDYIMQARNLNEKHHTRYMRILDLSQSPQIPRNCNWMVALFCKVGWYFLPHRDICNIKQKQPHCVFSKELINLLYTTETFFFSMILICTSCWLAPHTVTKMWQLNGTGNISVHCRIHSTKGNSRGKTCTNRVASESIQNNLIPIKKGIYTSNFFRSSFNAPTT